VARLRALGGGRRLRVADGLASEPGLGRFNTGACKKRLLDSRRPGSRFIHLSKCDAGDDYFLIGAPERWGPSRFTAQFGPLMQFIATLPFAATSRILIMADARGRRVPAHRDHASTELLHEFIWFRTNLDKPFYVADAKTGAREYVRSYSAWFDTVNQYHGADATDSFTFSVRVDGAFSDSFRAQIPRPPCNLASTPSLWAARQGEPA
jgi:hypothetical protein